MKYSEEQLRLIWLDSFIGLEYKHKKYLYESLAKKERIKQNIQDNKDYIISEIGENQYNTIYNSANSEYLQFVCDNLNRLDIKAITLYSDDYPDSLRNTDFPPLVLYTVGDLGLFKENLFGIVGSRKNLPMSVNLAGEFTKELIKGGFIPITGTAEGIDQKVIETALSNGGRVVSVVAGGIDCVYPSSNIALIEKVKEKGLVISENPPQIKPLPYFFPVRNRIIAGLSQGVLIVSGSKRSGTLHTASYAAEYGKEIFAIPYNIGISSGEGCNELIKMGAHLCTSPKDILSFYGIEEVKDEQKRQLTDKEKQIISALKDGELHIEKLSQLLNRKVFELSSDLTMLEIDGLIYSTGVNTYGLTPKGMED